MPEGGKPTLEQGPARTHGERGAHAGGGFLAGLVTPMEEPYWNSLFLKDCTLWEGLTLK